MKTVFRVQPVERAGVKGIAGHNARQPGHESEHIDPARTHLNFFLRGDKKIENILRAAIDGVPMARSCKDRSKENVAAEMVFSASPEFFENGGDVQAWAKKTLEWIDRTFPGRCISAVIHMDEQTPHMHAILRVDAEKARINPVTKEPMQAKRVLNYSDFFMDRKDVLTKARLLGTSHTDTKLGRLQTSYADAVASFGLERGECSARSKRAVQHLPPAEYREREKALEEQAVILEQTKKARADLSAIQKSVAVAKSEKLALEKEAAALSMKIEERQKGEKVVDAALISKKAELQSVEKLVAEKYALMSEFEGKAAAIMSKAKSEYTAAQDQLSKLKGEGEKAKATVDVLRADASKMELRAGVLREEIATLEKQIPEKLAVLSDAEKRTDKMIAQYDEAKIEYDKAVSATGAWKKEAEKFKDQVAEKTPLPVWSIICKQASSAAVAADFVKSLPENVARAIAKTAPEETQQKLIQQIRSVHARSHGMSMGR